MRIARHNVPGHVYHLISRFVGNEWLVHDDEDRWQYLQLLGLALAESDWLCLAYAIMSNHIHLAMIAGRTALADWIRSVHSPFADELNRRRRRIGPVFVRGPKDHWIGSGKVGDLIAYIHRNPVRARVVERARESSWTSHCAYAGLSPAPAWLHVDEGLRRAGFPDAARFDEWVDANEGDAGTIRLEELRRFIRKRGAIELATPSITEVPLVARPFAAVRPDPRHVVKLVADVTALPAMMVSSRGRKTRVVRARRIAVKCAEAVGIAGCDIAAALGISPQAVSKIAATATLDEEMASQVARVIELLVRELRG